MGQTTLPSEWLRRTSRRLSPTNRALIILWVGLVGTYSLFSLFLHPGRFLTAAGDIGQCLAAAFATAGLLMNAFSPHRRTRAFWLLLALGCGSWLAGQITWSYFEIVLRRDVPNPFLGDVVLFLHAVPMMWALTLRPHDGRDDLNVQLSYVDFGLLLVWWVYLYLFVVIPWQYILPDVLRYGQSYDNLEVIENMVVTFGLGALILRVRGQWQSVYGHLFGASLLFAIGAYITNVAIDRQDYYTGSPFDLPLVVSLLWYGTAGFLAYQIKPGWESYPVAPKGPALWPARLAIAAVFSMPALGMWGMFVSKAPASVRNFRTGVTQIAVLIAALFIFLRQRLVDQDRLRLLQASQDSYDDLKHLQSHLVQSEKLVSLGQLAAGAAHEINNPLAGILGYSDLLIDDHSLSEKQRALAEKIRTLARRIKTLVTNLLSFARRMPSEKTLLDLNQILSGAIHLSNLDLREKTIQVQLDSAGSLPPVRGDANQILQVFFNLIDNAVDALEEVGGGRLLIRSYRNDANVVFEFSDTGPGIQSPTQVFDPFFTTKPVGKGTGLGLSICYGIVQEHGGRIECFNRSEGGATFVVHFPMAADDTLDQNLSPSVSANPR
jgi:signal transduction histidine kinase